jgi:hypothetical protein
VSDAWLADTGVFLRWFIDQDGFEHAQMARERNLPLLTSDAKLCNAAGSVITTELLRGIK